MTDTDWPTLLTTLMDRANLLLQQGNRKGAAASMAQASELLFLQAQKTTNLDNKKRFVKRGGDLLKASLMLGGTVRVDIETPETPPSAVAVVPRAANLLSFADVAGLDAVKETLRLRVILPLRFPEKRAQYGITGGGGMLLYGPPGTGKTLLVRAVAGELGLPFFIIKSSEVLSQFFGQSEKQLAELFAEARSQPDGAIVFLDEIDALGAKRTEQKNEASRRVLTQLLQELDGVDGRSLVFFAATNEPWLLDSALLRPPRFSERCYVPLPDESGRRVLFEMGIRNCPVTNDVSPDYLAARSEGLSGADIANICERAKLIPFRESIDTGVDRPLSQRDFDAAMTGVRASVTPESLKRYENF